MRKEGMKHLFIIYILTFVIAVVIVTGLSGCTREEKGNSKDRFVEVYINSSDAQEERVFVDTETGVTYLEVKYYIKGGVGLTPLYNADGSLMITEIEEEE